MNEYLKNVEKVEFVVTDACTGRCKHCSEGDHSQSGKCIDPKIAGDVVKKLASVYGLKTVMAFGGEPLLYPECVYEIMREATKANVPKRQVITNGYFTNDEQRMADVAQKLADCGVNELLLSADAFHQEYIPLENIIRIAKITVEAGLKTKVQPAWLVSRDDSNKYNAETKKIVAELCSLGITENEGNAIFPEGNAKKYLAEYFVDANPQNPYVEDPYNIKCVSVGCEGTVLGDNVYKNDILEIIKSYVPLC